MKQLTLITQENKAFGGDLYKRRRGRGRRPISTKESLHIVLRSTKAKGAWSFLRKGRPIIAILNRFATRHGVQILNVANVGNHIHLHVRLAKRVSYVRFIRAVTAAIVTEVTGRSRWKQIDGKFWDRRPFTRVIVGFRAFLTLKDYIRINRLEGGGTSREEARMWVQQNGGS